MIVEQSDERFIARSDFSFAHKELVIPSRTISMNALELRGFVFFVDQIDHTGKRVDYAGKEASIILHGLPVAAVVAGKLGSGPLELSNVQGGFVGLVDFQLLIFPEATDGADVLIELGVTWAITFREGTVGLEAMFAADKCFAVSLAFFLFKLMRVQTRAGIPNGF